MAQLVKVNPEVLVDVDYLLVIESPAELDQVKNNPRGFMEEIGALDKVKEFHGIDLGDKERHDFQNGGSVYCCHKTNCDWIYCN
jgi:hypothetical protein